MIAPTFEGWRKISAWVCLGMTCSSASGMEFAMRSASLQREELVALPMNEANRHCERLKRGQWQVNR